MLKHEIEIKPKLRSVEGLSLEPMWVNNLAAKRIQALAKLDILMRD